MNDTIVIALCLAGLWVLLVGLLLVETRSDSWIGVSWRNADVTSQVSKNARAVCIPALICLSYLVLYVKAAASWGGLRQGAVWPERPHVRHRCGDGCRPDATSIPRRLVSPVPRSFQ